MLSVILVLVAFIVGYVSYVHLPTAFLPSWDEGYISVPFRTPIGENVQYTTKIGDVLMKEAANNPNVEKVSLMIGRGFGNSYSTPNKGILMIVLKKHRQITTQELMLNLEKKFKEIVPNLITLNPSQVMVNRLGDLSGSHATLEVFLFGSNPTELYLQGKQIASELSRSKIFESVSFKSPSAGSQINFSPSLYGYINGIDSYNLAKSLKLHFWGENAGFLLKGEQIIPIRLTLQNKPLTLDRLEKLNILIGNKLFNLGTISTMHIKDAVPYVTHQNLVPYSYIWLKPYNNVGLNEAAKNVQKIIESANLPKNISYSIGGYYKEQTKSFKDMYLILSIAVIVLVILFGFQFSSQKAAISATISMVTTATFSLLLLLIFGIHLDSTAFLGILLVFAIVVNNIILIFARSKQLCVFHSPSSVALAARSRFRPIIMTMLADIFGFLPLAIGIGTGTDLLKPLAIATIGGLIFGVFASLVLTPSLFVLFNNYSKSTTNP